MMREKILFIVHTEYHMMVAISLIADMYSDGDKFDIQVFQTIGKKSSRFKFVKDLSLCPHVSYTELPYDEGEIEYNPHFKFYADSLRSSIDVFITFNKLSFIDVYTIKTLDKTGTRIILAPDGAAAYGKTSAFTPRWSFLVALKMHQYLWKNQVRKLYFYWPTLVYGGMKEIDELWVQFPESIDDRAGKPVRKIQVLKSLASHQLAQNYFGYQPDNFAVSDCIFYTNQPFREESINDFEIKLLKELKEKFPEKLIFIKLHPTTFESQAIRFKELGNVRIIQSTVPAEIYISQLRDSIALSFWSTSMLIDNDSCRIYWLFPMLYAAGIKLRKTSINLPSDHIQLVSSVAEII